MLLNRNRKLRAGDEVMVRSPEEIMSTLDDDAALDGLPFMPEMVDFCGKRLRVARRVEKTCVEDLDYKMQRFPDNDVVFLENLRCSGAGHDGCKRGCMIFWKEAWLRRSGRGTTNILVDDYHREQLRKRLKTKESPSRYFCQSTQLLDATKPFPWMLKPWMVWVAAREVWFGDRSVMEVTGLMVSWTLRMLRRIVLGKPRLRGPHKRTPTQSLGLTPAEWVSIKPLPQILETLDRNGDNRGLNISHAMSRNCGGRFQVADKVDRIISETTGEMREVHNTVTLRGLNCHCYYQLGSCPRGDLQFWREIWLEPCEEAMQTCEHGKPDFIQDDHLNFQIE